MDHAAPAFTEARDHMVDSQIRPNKVTDPRIIAAMRRLPRERFLPPHLDALAYADADVPLGGGRVLLEPMVIARLVQLDGGRRRRAGARGGRRRHRLRRRAARLLRRQGHRPRGGPRPLQARCRTVAGGTGAVGQPGRRPARGRLAAGAPYDVILIEGAVRDIPPAIGEQFAGRPGRLVTICTGGGAGVCQAVLAEATTAGLRHAADVRLRLGSRSRAWSRSAGFVF